ncbi:MAG: hypothetical protein WC284_06040 [Candidimonas sp.]
MNPHNPAVTQHSFSGQVLRYSGMLAALFALTACGDGSGPGFVYECQPGQACGSSDGPPPPSQVVTCVGSNEEEIQVHPKTITIHNNSATDTIYPVLATSKNAKNEWLQGCWRSNDDYPTPHVYKLYVNEGKGIPPDSAVTVTLPLYSALTEGALNGEYITWWNGGRVVLADNDERLLERKDEGHPNGQDAPLATPEGVTCTGDNTECALTTYYSDVQFPENIYAQLSEYTFGDSIVPAGEARRILKPENVGYNISYVDHVYMPVAIGPKNNPYIGFSGSTQPLAEFRRSLSAFLSDSAVGEGWPVYNLDELKLPGGYNIFAQRSGTLPPSNNVPVKPDEGFPPVLTVLACIKETCTDEQKRSLHFGQAVQRMQNLWGSCVDWDGEDISGYVTDRWSCPSDLQHKLATVKRFFKQSHENYLALYAAGKTCEGSTPLVPKFDFWNAMTHIYGWVPFNEGCGAGANPLADTQIPDLDPSQPPWDHARIQSMYIHDLQYNHQDPDVRNDPKQVFNPYVQLIHDDLEMNAYAFSVDDAVGFMSELGDGLIFTVGGPKGLENQAQFDYAGGFTLAIGVPEGLPQNKPLIKWYGVCSLKTQADDPECENFTQDVDMPDNSQIAGFRVGTVAGYPIRVRFTDLEDNRYSILVKERFAKCDETDSSKCPTNKAAIVDQAACIVTDGQGQKHANSDRWCQSANPNQQKEKQLTKNYLSFATPVGLLP